MPGAPRHDEAVSSPVPRAVIGSDRWAWAPIDVTAFLSDAAPRTGRPPQVFCYIVLSKALGRTGRGAAAAGPAETCGLLRPRGIVVDSQCANLSIRRN